MANATFTPNGTDDFTVTLTSGDDTLTLNTEVADADVGAETHTLNAGLGSDTIVFDGALGASGSAGAGVFEADGAAFSFEGGNAGDTFNAQGAETFVFENGTVTSSSAAQLLAGAINEEVNTLAGTAIFDVSTLLDWNGSSAADNAGWTISSINGQASSGGATFFVLDGTDVQGEITVNGANNEVTFDPTESFQSSIGIGNTETISIDVELENGGDTFTETLTVDVVGVATSQGDTYSGTDAEEGLGAGGTFDFLGGNDFAVLTTFADDIDAGAGNDTIYAGANDMADDSIIGGDGNDLLGGGGGDDTLEGGNDNDTIFGGAGDDDIDGGSGENTIYAGAGGDTVVVGNDNDAVYMGQGADDVTLGDGEDTVYGGTDDTGNDTVDGSGAGDDIIYTGGGDDDVTGGDDNDEIGLGAGDDTVDAGTGDDTVYGGAGDDEITGNDGADELFGAAGIDTLDGGVGEDEINGGADNDELTGGDDSDTFVFVEGDGQDAITDFDNDDAGGDDDLIDLSGTGLSFADLEIVEFDSGGADDYTVVSYGDSGDTITLTGVLGVEESDFIF